MLLELIFILFFGIGDYVTTKFIMLHGGRELNPIVFVILKRWGYRGFAAIKLLLIVLVVFVYPSGLLLAGTIISVAVVMWNVTQCYKYYHHKTNVDGQDTNKSQNTPLRKA